MRPVVLGSFCLLAALLGAAPLCQGRATLGRLHHNPAPQHPATYRQWRAAQQLASRRLHQANSSPAPASPSPPQVQASSASPSPPPTPGQQQPNVTTQQGPQAAASSANSSSTSSTAAAPPAASVRLCPAWASSAATTTQTLPALPAFNTTTDIDVVTDLNTAPDGGLTQRGRQGATAAAVVAAVARATNNATQIEGQIDAVSPPGMFEPLSEDEIMAVYDFLFSQPSLNLTPTEDAQPTDNYVAWLELAPPNKDAALAALDGDGPAPNRSALALLIQGRADPPRVTQVRVGPLPEPESWEYVALGPEGTMEAGWLQRPYTPPESNKGDEMMLPALAPLVPLMKAAFDGWFLGPKDNASAPDPCGDKCLTFSVGAPFGSGPAQPSGTRVDPVGGGGAGGNESDARFSQRRLWAFFYRNMEGHHLHTVGLELAFDQSDYDPAKWKPGPVWFADTLWPSIDNLVAAWNATMAAGNSGSSNGSAGMSVPADVAERLRTFKAVTPSPADSIYSSFAPRAPEDAAGSAAPPTTPTNTTSNGTTTASPKPAPPPPGPPVVYEPTGRRFRLGQYSLEGWMGWSLALGHRPTSGLSFWDIRFKGERVVYELSLQEAYAGYGGPSPMQAHVQYFDSHWGYGTAYKELVGGSDCPLNAAFMDLTFSFNGGPVTMRNALCVFELPLGKPLLRHWSDASGDPLYYGAVAASSLVIRGISAVYNYDYIQDLLLHLDGSLEVAVHTTGYPQPARFNRARDGNRYGYPLWYDVSGTIHDHLVNWKVDLDVAGTANSIRIDNVVQEERRDDNGFPQGGVPWFNKRVEQVFPETEAEATLFWNGSSKAAPDKRGKTGMYYIVNEDKTNRWGSARGYRLQHTLTTEQVLPEARTFGNLQGINWSKYKVAVTARREWEQSGATALNQALPFAPVFDFDDLLATSSSNSTPPGLRNASAPTTAPPARNTSDKGDRIRKQDLVLWVSSGLQHLPGAEDAPVTPSSGPGIGFWLRPFNYFNESAAISQPGSVVYIPMLSGEAGFAAQAAVEADNVSAFSLQDTFGLGVPGNSSAPKRLFKDDATVVVITDPATLEAARRGVQPYVGVGAAQACTPNWAGVPAFNGSYAARGSAPEAAANVTGNATGNGTAGGVAVGATASAAAGAAGPTGGGASRSRGGPFTGR